jgi:hypothetical protein
MTLRSVSVMVSIMVPLTQTFCIKNAPEGSPTSRNVAPAGTGSGIGTSTGGTLLLRDAGRTQTGAPVFPPIISSPTLPYGFLFNFSIIDAKMQNAHFGVGHKEPARPCFT